MIVSFKNIYVSLFVSLQVILFFNTTCQSQDTVQIDVSGRLERAEIEWLTQWPSPESKNQKDKAKQKLKEFFFGKKDRELNRPVSVLAANQNSFWILDQENGAIFLVNNKAGKIPHFIERGNNVFPSLVSICSFHTNEFLVTDSYLNKIFLINPEKKKCTILNDSLKLNKPTGIAFSPVNNEIWVIETGAHRIVVLNDKGEIIKEIGHRGVGKVEFNFPTHICIDKKGNVYVVDAMNFRIQVFNKEGELISVFGSNGDATGFFASPKGIATDSYGHIYVADALFHAVQVFDINGNFLYTFGSQGQSEGQFWMPSGIYIDDSDKIYVADSYNSRIQMFQLIVQAKQ